MQSVSFLRAAVLGALISVSMLCTPVADAGVISKAAKAVFIVKGGKAAAKAITRKLQERAAKKAEQLAANRLRGKSREQLTENELRHEHPNGSVQREQYLRDAEGKIARDSMTGEARRVDHVVIENGKVVRKVETTGMDVSKLEQFEKEDRIIEEGGRFIRDRSSGELLPVDGVEISHELLRRGP